jgi:hypothetical protein
MNTNRAVFWFVVPYRLAGKLIHFRGPYCLHHQGDKQAECEESIRDKGNVAKHSINPGHCIQLQNTTILSTKPRYINKMNREATKIELHPKNINREDGLCLSQSQKVLIHSLKGLKETPVASLPFPTWPLGHTVLF